MRPRQQLQFQYSTLSVIAPVMNFTQTVPLTVNKIKTDQNQSFMKLSPFD